MSRYPALVAALQAERALRMTNLVRLDFASATKWIWIGNGPLRTADGQVWDGAADLVTISDLDRSLVSGSPPTLTLSGVSQDLVAKTLAASTEVKGRPCRIFEQYFDAASLALVDMPIPIYAGLMDRMTVTVADANTRTVTLNLVTLLFRRKRPLYAYLSDRTQQLLHPGDLAASQIPALVQADPKWPNYN